MARDDDQGGSDVVQELTAQTEKVDVEKEENEAKNIVADKVEGKKPSQTEPDEEIEKDSSIWFTKHSKAYRRAMRQEEL